MSSFYRIYFFSAVLMLLLLCVYQVVYFQGQPLWGFFLTYLTPLGYLKQASSGSQLGVAFAIGKIVKEHSSSEAQIQFGEKTATPQILPPFCKDSGLSWASITFFSNEGFVGHRDKQMGLFWTGQQIFHKQNLVHTLFLETSGGYIYGNDLQ